MDNRITEAERLALAELFHTDRHAWAEVVTEYVNPTYLSLDLAATFMRTREMNFNELPMRRFKGKYHVRQLAPGQIQLGEQITVRDESLSINLSLLSAKALYNTLELQHGGAHVEPETVRADVRAALAEQILMRGWNALASVWSSGNAAALTIPGSATSNFIDAAGPLTATALDAAIDHVNFWSEGGVRAIVGTESALAPLTTFGQYRLISGSNTDNFVSLQGTPGQFRNVSPWGPNPGIENYRGVSNIVRIKQIFDKTEFPYRPLLPTNFVLVIGDDVGEFITYGGPQYKEFIDNNPTPPYWTYETWQQFGMMVTNAMGLVKIAVTSTTP